SASSDSYSRRSSASAGPDPRERSCPNAPATTATIKIVTAVVSAAAPEADLDSPTKSPLHRPTRSSAHVYSRNTAGECKRARSRLRREEERGPLLHVEVVLENVPETRRSQPAERGLQLAAAEPGRDLEVHETEESLRLGQLGAGPPLRRAPD